MHSTVLVAKSQASSQRGESVYSTSHSGITVCSSTWLLHSVPVKVVTRSQPTLRSAPGPGSFSVTTPAARRSSWGALGSRVIQTELAIPMASAKNGTPHLRTVSVSSASAMPAIRAPMVKPRLRLEYMNAWVATRSLSGSTSRTYAFRPAPPALLTTSKTTMTAR